MWSIHGISKYWGIIIFSIFTIFFFFVILFSSLSSENSSSLLSIYRYIYNALWLMLAISGEIALPNSKNWKKKKKEKKERDEQNNECFISTCTSREFCYPISFNSISFHSRCEWAIIAKFRWEKESFDLRCRNMKWKITYMNNKTMWNWNTGS